MSCPTCRSRTTWEGNPYRPFCSLACRLIDLGCWIDVRYRVEGNELIDDDATAEEPRARNDGPRQRTERHVP